MQFGIFIGGQNMIRNVGFYGFGYLVDWTEEGFGRDPLDSFIQLRQDLPGQLLAQVQLFG